MGVNKDIHFRYRYTHSTRIIPQQQQKTSNMSKNGFYHKRLKFQIYLGNICNTLYKCLKYLYVLFKELQCFDATLLMETNVIGR